MTQFSELYKYCQTLKPKISRRDIRRKTLELTKTELKAAKQSLDTKICRGFFVSASNKENRWVQQFGCNVIVVARELNYCWERFVYTKEMMHLFDEESELTGNAEDFEKLLTEFGQSSVERPAQSEAEAKAFWMALSCFCPEPNRLEFRTQLENKHIDNYAIALQLRIPELYVPLLFVPNYSQIIEDLIK